MHISRLKYLNAFKHVQFEETHRDRGRRGGDRAKHIQGTVRLQVRTAVHIHNKHIGLKHTREILEKQLNPQRTKTHAGQYMHTVTRD